MSSLRAEATYRKFPFSKYTPNWISFITSPALPPFGKRLVTYQIIHSASKHYGFTVGECSFEWRRVKEMRDAYVRKLNGIYHRNVEKAGVTLVYGVSVGWLSRRLKREIRCFDFCIWFRMQSTDNFHGLCLLCFCWVFFFNFLKRFLQCFCFLLFL